MSFETLMSIAEIGYNLGMRSNRQPTITTWLLMTVVIAILCAVFQQLIPMLGSRPFYWDRILLLLSAVIFWTVPPLMISLMCRSVERVGAICLGFGVVWICAECLVQTYLKKISSVVIASVLDMTIEGPFLWLTNWRISQSLDLYLIVVYAEWVLAFSVVGMLFAISCRLRPDASKT